MGYVLQPTRRGRWAPHGLCVSRGGGVKVCATLPWPFSGWSLQFVFAVLTRRSPIGGSGCQGCAAPSAARPGLDAGATGDYIAWPSTDGKRQRPDAGQGSGPRAAPQPRGRRDTPRPWGAFHGSCVSRTQPDSERPLVLPPGAKRLAEPLEGDGGGRNQPHGQSAAAPVLTAVPPGGRTFWGRFFCKCQFFNEMVLR